MTSQISLIKGNALLIPSGTLHAPDRKHMFVICNDACSENKHLLVTVSKWRNVYSEGTCIIEPGEHSFIKMKSYIRYQKTRIEKTSTLQNGIKNNDFIIMDDVDEELMDRICNGITSSPHIPRKYKKYYKDLIS